MKNLPPRKPSVPKSSGNKFFDARQRLLSVEKNRKAGNLALALSECQALLRQFPDYVGALHNIGLIYSEMGDTKNAIFNFSYAAGLDPQNLPVQLALAKAFSEAGSIEMSLSILKRLEVEFAETPEVLISLGLALNKSQEFEKALIIFDRAIKLNPTDSDPWKGKSFAYLEMGESKEAVSSILNAVQFGDTDMSALSFLSKAPNEIVNFDLMKRLEATDKSTLLKSKAYITGRDFAKADILISQGNVKAGFAVLKEANRIKFEAMADAHRSSVNASSAFYSALTKAPKLPEYGKTDGSTPASIFLFGPTRSGKSSLERLLGIFPSVRRGYESDIVRVVAHKTCARAGMPNRDFAFQIPPAFDDLLRDFYIKELEERTADKRVLTITSPARILDAYHLARIIPNTRFVFIKRDIDDVVYRMFNILYLTGNAHSYNLDAAREHVRLYYQMQDKLAELLPGITMTVNYEDMVQDTVAAVKSVQEFCGIDGNIGKLPDIGDDRGYAQKFLEL